MYAPKTHAPALYNQGLCSPLSEEDQVKVPAVWLYCLPSGPFNTLIFAFAFALDVIVLSKRYQSHDKTITLSYGCLEISSDC